MREQLTELRGGRPRDGIRDQILFVSSVRAIRPAAFSVLTRVQDHEPAAQVLGTAVALKAMCDAVGIRVADVMTRADNMMEHAEAFSPAVRAINDYARNEIARVPRTREELGVGERRR